MKWDSNLVLLQAVVLKRALPTASWLMKENKFEGIDYIASIYEQKWKSIVHFCMLVFSVDSDVLLEFPMFLQCTRLHLRLFFS